MNPLNTHTLVLVDGNLLPEYSIPPGIQFRHLQDGNGTIGTVIQVSKNIRVSSPIHLIFKSTKPAQIHNHILVEGGAEISLLEEYIAAGTEAYTTSVKTEIHAGTNAIIRHYKVQDENQASKHSASILVHQQKDSRVDLFNLSKGALVAEEDVQVKLTAQGAECHLSGWYALQNDGQQLTQKLFVDHAAKNGISSMLYKGTLDKRSQAAFNGKVYVHPQAQHISASQANHNLLLSKTAEVSSKPDLEIYADDVKCTHGATIGQLDAEALFYFRSRGMDRQTATQFLLEAFADEVMNRIENSAIRQYVQARAGRHVEL